MDIADRLRRETAHADTIATMATTRGWGAMNSSSFSTACATTTMRCVLRTGCWNRWPSPTTSRGISCTAGRHRHYHQLHQLQHTRGYAAGCGHRDVPPKAAGKACCMLFDREMHQQAMARLTLENDLRAAITNQQFVLHYQPIVSLENGTTIGLRRWCGGSIRFGDRCRRRSSFHWRKKSA